VSLLVDHLRKVVGGLEPESRAVEAIVRVGGDCDRSGRTGPLLVPIYECRVIRPLARMKCPFAIAKSTRRQTMHERLPAWRAASMTTDHGWLRERCARGWGAAAS
jgi:hypothetical protein